MSNAVTLRRLFFALWPDEAVRNEMVRQFKRMLQHDCPGNKMLPSNLHLTLHFIGNVDDAMTSCLQQAASTIKADSFELRLDKPGYFPLPGIFWIGCSELPEALMALHHQLARVLLPCGYKPESRPYSPHITLMRKLREAGDFEPVEPVVWAVKSFALIESLPTHYGVQYQVRQNYFLE
jgi:2'-5' RNA ligase